MLNFRKTLESITLSLSLLSTGCNVIERIKEDRKQTELRKQGYNPYHLSVCGPNSLSELLAKFNIKIEEKEISKEIILNYPKGNLLRTILSFMDNKATMITWPWEIKETLEKYLKDNYEIIEITGQNEKLFKQLNKIIKKDKKAIVLIKDKNELFSYHWMLSFNNPLNFYGQNTQLCAIYLIDEKLSRKIPNPIANKDEFILFLYKNFCHAILPKITL